MSPPPQRCAWVPLDQAAYIEYHDTEWGVPVTDDETLFEFLILEGAQAGLSWSTILNKRDGYRKAFAGFDPIKVAAFTGVDKDRLRLDPSIVRNRAKIASAVSNAQAFLTVQAEYGAFATYLWDFVGGDPLQPNRQRPEDVPAETELSRSLAKDLKQRKFRFVGPTIMYAFLQATGAVNDHTVDCFRHEALAERSR